jgi:hypothetical protein
MSSNPDLEPELTPRQRLFVSLSPAFTWAIIMALVIIARRVTGAD